MFPSEMTEDPVSFGEHVYVARRNAGEDRWQVSQDGRFAPVGFIEQRFDPECERVGLFVFGPDGTSPIGESVATYHNALSHLRMQGFPIS